MTDESLIEKAGLAIARSMPGWNEDTTEPDIPDPYVRRLQEEHWERVNAECLRQGVEHARVALAVFEEAHAPTDDERHAPDAVDALVASIEWVGSRLVEILHGEGHDHECDALVTENAMMCDCWWGRVRKLGDEMVEVQKAAAGSVEAAGFRRSVESSTFVAPVAGTYEVTPLGLRLIAPAEVQEPSAPHCDGCARFAHHHCYHCGKRAGLPHAPFCPNFTDLEPKPQGEPSSVSPEPECEDGTPRDFQAYELTVDMLEDLLVTAGVTPGAHGTEIRKTASALVYKIGRRLATESQAEPSDAEVEEALEEWNRSLFMHPRDVMRAVLRAAAAVRKEGRS